MKNKNDEGIKSRILAESVRLFSEKGFHGTSMRDIAAQANCSLPMLYYYYKNKEELFYEVAYKEMVLMIERLNSYGRSNNPLIGFRPGAIKTIR